MQKSFPNPGNASKAVVPLCPPTTLPMLIYANVPATGLRRRVFTVLCRKLQKLFWMFPQTVAPQLHSSPIRGTALSSHQSKCKFFLSDLLPSSTFLSSSSCVIFRCVYISITAAAICSRLTFFNGERFPFHRGHMWWRDVEEVERSGTKGMAEMRRGEPCRPQ